MNARITLKPEHVAVLAIHAGSEQPLTLKQVERSMGERGLRTPAAEAHAFCIAQRLLVPGRDGAGQEYPNRYVLSVAGERGMKVSAYGAHAELDKRVADVDRLGQEPREKERLEELRKVLPERPAKPPASVLAESAPSSDAEADEREEEPQEADDDGEEAETTPKAKKRKPTASTTPAAGGGVSPNADALNADVDAARARFTRGGAQTKARGEDEQPAKVSSTGKAKPRKAASAAA